MLRDVVIHLNNDQPILADLAEEPGPGDVSVICTNLRTQNGKTPVFVERADSTFVFPMAQIRFIEIHAPVAAGKDGEDAAGDGSRPSRAGRSPAKGPPRASGGKPDTRRGSNDDGTAERAGPSPLERLAWVSGEDVSPPADAVSEESEDESDDPDELMRRVKEV